MDKTSLPSYTPLERLHLPRPVDRIPFLREAVRDRRVLDLGAMDETAFEAKRGRGSWLHEELARHAVEVVGVDSSDEVPESGLTTSERSRIIRGDIFDLGTVMKRESLMPDVVVAGEIIEHLDNPLLFLKSIKAEPRLAGKRLYLSTPNASALHNGLVGLLNRESTHRDHLCILSYKTLCTLCSRAGFSRWTIIPYRSRFTEMKSRNPGAAGLLVATGERIINAAEWMFPVLSFGYVVEIDI